ncbi:MAG: histidine kinase [Methylibium sp. NZG]|nr:MAG: histidine kinase [Methylibium sp. NZG]
MAPTPSAPAVPRPTERRVGDRRGARRAVSADESWFKAFGPVEDPTSPRAEEADEPPSTEDADLGDAETAGDEPTPAAHGRTAVEGPGQTTFARLFRTFIGARAVLGMALVATLGVVTMFGVRPSVPVATVSIIYAALALSMWLMPRLWGAAGPQSLARLGSPQWLGTIGADLVCFMLLHLLAPGSSLNYVPLLVMPVLMAGVLTPRTMALATVAGVTLTLLGAAWLAALSGGDITVLMTQAGLAGSGFFILTVLVGELAGRLAREEITSRGSLKLARLQAQLNRLVIEEMQDGVLVVDRSGRVRAANPAARRLLWANGMCRPAPFQMRGVAAWEALVRTAERAFVDAAWPEAGRDVTLDFAPGSSRTLRVRIRFTRKAEPQGGEEFCVMFLEDVRILQARSRQEKLAAMGRVSAGVAHEIRNPLAAISQANALLAEDARDPDQQRLLQMVTENVQRLKRIVDDVMTVAPGQTHDVHAIDATAQVAAVCREWAAAAGIAVGEQGLLQLHLPDESLGALFDPEHLRRVLVNLLDNARRHASQNAGAIEVRLDSRDETRVFLSVSSDGASIPVDVERYLFEPFFSTRSRGTGLGLYICRELCERYGASIDYRLRHAVGVDRNEFFVAMRRSVLGTPETKVHADS